MPYIGNIVQDFSVNTAMLNTDSVTSIKIDDGTIVNADINDSAAIAVSKLSGVMPSAGGTFSGDVSFGDNNITNVGTIALDTIKGDADDNTNINFAGSDTINIKPAGTTRLSINTSGVVVTGSISATGSLACGDITSSDGNGNLTIKDNNHTGSNCEHLINFTASDDTSLMNIGTPFGSNALFFKYGSTELVKIDADGQVDFAANVDCNAGLDVTGAITGTTDLTINTSTLKVDSANNRVGVGTNSPSNPFHAVSTAATIANFQRDSSTSNVAIQFKNDTASMFCGLTASATGFGIDDDNDLGTGPMFFVQRSSGNVGIGTTSPTSLGSGFKELIIGGDTEGAGIEIKDSNANVRGGLFTSDNTNAMIVRTITNHPLIFRTDNTVAMTIDSDQRLGIGTTSAGPKLHAASGSDTVVGARITGGASGGTDIADFRTNNGTIRMKINNDVTISTGNLVIGGAGKGIDFSAQTASSATGATTGDEVLDHYEEGTWTPVSTGSHTLGGAMYTKIGRVVYIFVYLSALVIPDNTSDFTISGLPFTVSSANDHYPPLSIGYSGAGTLPAEVRFLFYSGASSIISHTTAGSSARVNNSVMRSYLQNHALILSGFYFV